MSNNDIHMNDSKVPVSDCASESEISRRKFLKGSAALGGLSVLATSPLAATRGKAHVSSGEKKPNILIIISDQMNIDAIGHLSSHFKDPAYGGHWAKTPHLNRLASEGTSFIESHSANPVCSPSRSCIFTGRMAIETAVVVNNIGIAKDVPNMGQWFEQHSSYNRVYCGKWHLGGDGNYPTVSGPRKPPGFEVMPVNGPDFGIHADPQVSNSAAAFITNYREEQPYLFVASLMNPHDICYWAMNLCGPHTTPETDVFDLKSKLPVLPPNFHYNFTPTNGLQPYEGFRGHTQWRNYTYDYYRMVEDIDTHVGRIMDAVRARNDDTVVVFIADHGEGLGRHHLIEKWHPYQAALTVPFIIWSPNRIKAGAMDTTHLVSNVDIMPTLCDYAGIAPPPHHRGFSLRSLADQQAEPPTAWRDNVYAEWQITGRLIRTKKYKYAMKYQYSGNFEKPYVRKSDGGHTQFVPGHGDEYAEYPNPMLFDMENDPWELNDLINAPGSAAIVAEHRRILRDWEAKLIPGKHFNRV